jgi:GNAT superfamily N-acetyltransferase
MNQCCKSILGLKMSITIESMNQEVDWPKVQHLLQSTPMTASLPLVASRLNSPELAYPVIKGKIFDLVAKKDGKIIGFIHGRQEEKMCYRDGQFNRIVSVYLGDFRVDRSARRLGVASQLGHALKKYCADQNLTYGWSVVFAKNKPMINFYSRFAENVQHVRDYWVVSRLILARPQKKENFSYERFIPEEKAFEILAKELGNRFLGPAVSAQDIKVFYQQYPEIRFYRRKGKNEIAFALWNQGRFRRLLLTELPWFVRIVRWGWNSFGRFTGAHPFPKAGEPWNSAELTLFTEKQPAADFEKLIVAEAYDMGCHTLNLIESGLGGDYPYIKITGPAYRSQLKLMSYSLDGISPLNAPDFVMADVDLGFV